MNVHRARCQNRTGTGLRVPSAMTRMEHMAESSSEYVHHLAQLQDALPRPSRGVAHDAALVYSGPVLPTFRDDQGYPFKAQAWFSIWAPMTPAPDCFLYVKPGATPLLLICAPPDFWYEQPPLPTAQWTRHFELRRVASLAAARAALPHDLSGVALIGPPDDEISHWGLAAVNPEKTATGPGFHARRENPLRVV